MMEAIDQQAGVSLDVLLEGLVDAEVLQQHGDVMVSGLVNDSRKVNEGDMFIAYQGLTTHGLLYARDVAKKGAAVVLWDDDCDNCADIIRDISESKNFQEMMIPSTIQDIIMARVDALPKGAKDILQTGSVIEREFSLQLMKQVANISFGCIR